MKSLLPWQTPEIIGHTAGLVRSLKRWTGRDLLPAPSTGEELARRVFEASFVLVSHGTEADPVLNYGNAAALKLWDMTWEDFIRTPSRLTAEAPEREERARLLQAVRTHGYIDDYSGVRVTRTGRRFRISQATVWNLVDEQDGHCGQAAMFGTWTWL